MKSITARLKNLELAVEKSTTAFDMVILLTDETEKQAISARGHADARFLLVVNTDPRPKTDDEVDAEIAEIIKNLKSKGLSDEEIRSITEA